jgi:integration host factor subunit beta
LSKFPPPESQAWGAADVTKKEIVKDIADILGLTQLKTKEIVQMTFDAIIETLVNNSDHRIELRNFGVFEVKQRAARKARNPRTGERVDVPPKNVVTFKPGKRMEELVKKITDAPPLRPGDDDDLEDEENDVSAEQITANEELPRIVKPAVAPPG